MSAMWMDIIFLDTSIMHTIIAPCKACDTAPSQSRIKGWMTPGAELTLVHPPPPQKKQPLYSEIRNIEEIDGKLY
jgi:hypothetical protein